MAASLQDTGIPYFAKDEEDGSPAFDLQVDGESLAFGWSLVEAAEVAVLQEAQRGASDGSVIR